MIRIHEPRALAARYDPATGEVILALSDGMRFAFFARRVQGLEAAPDAVLASVEILPQGGGLRWEEPDVDVSVLGLMRGIFGTRAHMAELAARDGNGNRPA